MFPVMFKRDFTRVNCVFHSVAFNQNECRNRRWREDWSRWTWWFDLICEWRHLETEGVSLCLQESAFKLNYKSKCIPAVFLSFMTLKLISQNALWKLQRKRNILYSVPLLVTLMPIWRAKERMLNEFIPLNTYLTVRRWQQVLPLCLSQMSDRQVCRQAAAVKAQRQWFIL